MLKAYSEYKINNQTILYEHIDESYEPTQEEIREYAEYIGIDPDKESDLLWLAREGLMKPLPSGWKACQEENGELYYFNFDTGKSSWDHPYDDVYKARVIQEREKKNSGGMILDGNSKFNYLDIFNQTGKNTSSISDLSSGKNLYNLPISTKNDNQFDSQYVNSEPDDELIDSENAHSSDGFQKDVDFGIDRQLSACIEHNEDEPPVPSVEHPVIINKDTPREDPEFIKLRTRLEQSANDEKLQLLEDNRIYIENLKTELRLAKEREEQTLREKMKTDLNLIENTLRENFSHEKKSLETRQQNELNQMKQTFEKQKQDLQKKLRDDMLADINLEQQNNTNIQIRLLQMKYESDEKLRNVENRYKNELDDLTQRYEQTKTDKDTLEKRLKEKNDYCLLLQRTIDQLRGDKTSLERKLQDAESEVKSYDHSQRQVSINDETTLNNTKKDEDDDDDDALSDTDSDIIQMKETLNELKTISFQSNDMPKTAPLIRNNSLRDSGRWSNTLLSTITNNTYPLGIQNLNQYSSKTNSWQFQSSLITREAVLKAARDVLPPGVIDHLTSTH